MLTPARTIIKEQQIGDEYWLITFSDGSIIIQNSDDVELDLPMKVTANLYQALNQGWER